MSLHIARAGDRIALPLKRPWVARAGDRIRLPFAPDAPPPPDPEIVGDVAVCSSVTWGGLVPRLRSVATVASAFAAVRAARATGWGGTGVLTAGSASVWGGLRAARAGRAASWDASHPNALAALQAPWASKPTISNAPRDRWTQMSPRLLRGGLHGWTVPPSHARRAGIVWGGLLGMQRHADGLWTVPPKFEAPARIPWGQGHGLEWVVRPPPAPQPEPGGPRPPVYGRTVPLAFRCRKYIHHGQRVPLRFGNLACYAARDLQKAYVVLNTIEVVRLPDLLPIAVDAVSLGSSRDTWCWDAQLQLADPAQLAAVQPTATGPRQLRITINGYQWVIAVESFGRGREFGQARVDIAGRSVTAQLSEPYAPARAAEVSAARTMQQLAEAEVAGTDVTVQHDTVDWLVPGGAWYYDNQTPMSALLRIAAAAGAVVQSDPALPQVRIAPRYPVAPWDWTTTAPDVQIQDDIVTGERLQLQSRPNFDAVIVAGEKVGVAARVIREGEAGQTYAPQQIDQLMTHADGTRERGRNVLADRGGQAAVEHDIPLFPAPLATGQPGLVLPLQLARRITAEGTWHGVATAVRIAATRQGAAVDVVQTVTLERHYTDAD